jgi:hypothetical protein
MIKITTKEIKQLKIEADIWKEIADNEKGKENERLWAAFKFASAKATIKVLYLNELERFVPLTKRR